MRPDLNHREIIAVAVFFLAVGFSPMIASAIDAGLSALRRRRGTGYKSL